MKLDFRYRCLIVRNVGIEEERMAHDSFGIYIYIYGERLEQKESRDDVAAIHIIAQRLT